MRNRKQICPSIILAVAGVLGVTGCFTANLLRQPEESIKAWILTKTPLGSSPEEVETLIISQGWKKQYDWHGTPSNQSESFYPRVRGGHIIGAFLGQYRGIPFKFYVDAYWGFDASGKLIDLRVRKLPNAL